MRTLLIYPDMRVHVNYPLGLGIISSVLKEHGHETRILHFNEEMDFPVDMTTLGKNILDFDPQLIAFSSVSNQFRYVKQIAAFIKQKWDIPILCGGIHATIASEKVLQLGTIDIICRGEGEFPTLELVDKMERGEDYTTIPNMGFRENGGIKINPIRPLIDVETYDSLPFPDRDGFNFREIVKKKQGWANVMASRGCHMNCTYCVNHYYHQMYSPFHTTAENLRYRKISTVLREVEEMLDKYPEITLINFDDDIFTLDKRWLAEFCEEYPKKIKLPFACNVYPTNINPETASMLASAGCAEIKIGLESGSERVRRQILKRPSRDSVNTDAFVVAEEAGIRSWSFNMIGVPTETREEMLMTAKLNAKVRPYIVRCSIFYPYEGTDLYRYSAEHQLLHEERAENISSHLEDTVLDMPQLPREEILKFKTMFKWYVDAHSDIEAAPLFQLLISYFEKLPKEEWSSGRAKDLFQSVDQAIDMLLRELKLQHYATRRHLDLNFTKKLNYELP